jgi:hypothetical protein
VKGGRIGSAPPRGRGQVADRHLLPTRVGKLHLRTLAQAETLRGEYQPPREPQLDGGHLLDPWQ